MAKSLSGAITQIQTTVSGISGLNDPGHAAVDAVDNVPFVVTQPASGRLDVSIIHKGVHTISCGVYVPEDDYPRYRTSLIGYIESIYAALVADPTLSATVDTITEITYTYGDNRFGPLPVWGITFSIGVKIQ